MWEPEPDRQQNDRNSLCWINLQQLKEYIV